MSDDILYPIEKILDKRKANNRIEYKIKWEGYSIKECTWEPIENLQTAIELVEEYDKLHPNKKIKNYTPKSKLLGKKKKLSKGQKKSILMMAEKNNEGGQENEKNETNDKINIAGEENLPITSAQEEDYKRKYNIDDSLKKVKTVRKKDNKLVALVEKMKENGDLETIEIETLKLKMDNPWILLDFYESKIKFT